MADKQANIDAMTEQLLSSLSATYFLSKVARGQLDVSVSSVFTLDASESHHFLKLLTLLLTAKG